MKTDRSILLAFLAIILIGLTACSGSGGDPVTAKVFVNGTAMSANTKAVSDISFASANIIVGGDDITGQLEPVGTVDPATGEADQNSNVQSGNNNVEFETEITVPDANVTYSVEPKAGFVFDEWEIMRKKLVEEHPDDWRSMIVEIKKAVAGDRQTITIRPDLIQYIRPEFDRGAYVAFGTASGGDGSAAKPLSTMEEVIDFINKESVFDDDELTLKIRGEINNLDFSSLTSGRFDDETEVELKIIGGYGDNWNPSGNKSIISSITFPEIRDDAEIELEFRNIEFNELNLSSIFGNSNARDDDDDEIEIDFRNCSVVTLTGASNRVVNGLVVEKLADGTTGVTFVNSDAPYGDGNKYYHSVIRGDSIGEITGKNNIVVAVAPEGTPSGNGNDNYYNASFGEDYKDSSLEGLICTAAPLSEDSISGLDDDILEEDIEGRERYLSDEEDGDDDDDDRPPVRDIRVSYGPYEYKPIDD